MEAAALVKNEPSVIGAKVDISIQTGLYKGEYSSRMEDTDGDVWKLAHPFLGGGILPLYRGVEISLSVNVADGAAYKATASVLGTVRENNVVLLVVHVIGDVDRLQRRQFVRVPCLLDGWLTPLSDLPRLGIREWVNGHVKDISLGGARFSVPGRTGGSFDGMSRAIIRLLVDGQGYYLPCRLVMSRFNEETKCTDLGLAFEVLPGMVEKDLSRFIRRQELASRSDRK